MTVDRLGPGKPRVAVSSCLLGENVRYDGSNKKNKTVIDVLGQHFSFVPFCPEVAVGLGVPRPPINLISTGQKIRALGVEDCSVDVTDRLQAYAAEVVDQLPGICGYIFKQRSPSCGLGKTSVYHRNGDEIGVGNGLYTDVIIRMLPDLPVIDEEQLGEQGQQELFIQAVFRYHTWHNRFEPDIK